MRVRSRTTLALLGGIALGVAATMTGAVLADREPVARRDELVASRAAAVHQVQSPVDGLSWEDARRLAEILERVKLEYVDEVDDRVLIENAVRGLVSGLDPYSAYLDREEYDEIRLSTSGSYPGIGVEVAPEVDGIKVLRPIADSPAERAGLRSGDVIVKIDDAPVLSDVDAAIDQMRGPAGTLVKLSVRRPGAEQIVDLALERAQVEVHSVAAEPLEPGFGYLRITSFSDTTSQDVARAVSNLLAARPGARLEGLVIDLRNNPGGVLDSAVEVADAFLNSGIIVTADGRTPDARFRMDATPGELLAGTRVALLVNGGSASAAEILAGALKDNGRAVLVGRRTYGKGSVQTVIPLADGRALKLTTSHYATPAGLTIDQRGIDPAVVIEGPEAPPESVSAEAEVRQALQVLKSGVPAASPRLVAVAPR
ncbi:MAG: S41 family peptidase [Gammaproteobacteria bacterium]|nr:S41 family peptidase [Gammaproteobacteria bacterium]